MTKTKVEPKHKNKTFDSKEEFEKWLEEETTLVIEFEDHGQDFLKWHLDKHGEVLHSEPFQSFFWNGKFVNIGLLQVGKKVHLINEDRYVNYPLKNKEYHESV